MSCNPELVSCQLSRLADDAGAWNWNGFISTVIATIVGSILGLFGVWVTLRSQKIRRYQEALDESLERVLQEIASYEAAGRSKLDQEQAIREYERRGLDFFARTGTLPKEEPSYLMLSIAFDIAQMRARGGGSSFDRCCNSGA